MRVIHLSVPFILAIGLAACGNAQGDKAETTANTVQAKAVTISTARVSRVKLAVPIIATGSLTPSRQTDIGPTVDGIIEEVVVGVGARVKKGELLFRTRDVDIKLQVQELEKQVELARAQQKNVQSDFQRQTALKSGGWVSQSRMDAMRANAEVANAQVGVWEARLAQARQQLKDTAVRAPYNGIISRKDVYEGRFMATRFGGLGGGSSGVVQIMGIDPLAAIVSAPSIYFTQLKVGMPVKVHIDGMKEPVASKVSVVNYAVDYKSRAVEVRIAVPNADYKILPGVFCRVEISPEPRNAFVVERKAVLGSETSRYAYIVQRGRAKKITLTARDLDGELVEITSNVPEGTEFLTGPNLSQISDGTEVTIERTPVAAKPATQAKL